MNFKNLFIGVVFIITGCKTASTSSNNEPTISSTYVEDSTVNISNPDRGFYKATYSFTTPYNTNVFQIPKDQNFSLVFATINLSDYNTTLTLPDTLLTTIDTNLAYAETAGIKLILRIIYRPTNSYNDDPSKAIILDHMEQLKTLLQKHTNTISVVEAGIIGASGEWHSFTGDFATTNGQYLENRKSIINKLVEIFPDKYILIRTPMHKEQLFGSSLNYADQNIKAQITLPLAYTNDIRAKIGYHNDCFLADATDAGTYPSNAIEFWKNYVVNDTKYAPNGGETCVDNPNYTTCSNAIAELKKFRYSFLNNDYNLDVIKRWKDEGCYDEIKENLGYRLVAENLNVVQTSNNLSVSLSIKNKGYAAPYVKSNVAYILTKDINNSKTVNVDTDLRKFYPQETHTIDANISTINLASGDYCLYIKIGEILSAIKLSNKDLWNDANKTNQLTCKITLK